MASSSSSSIMPLWRRALKRGGQATLVLGGGYCGFSAGLYAYDRDHFGSWLRLQKTAVLASRMLSTYAWHLHFKQFATEEDREEHFHQCHLRHAPELRDLCYSNGGLYIKVGQILGLMDHILPYEYVESLAGCFDACPPSSNEDVETVFLEELGKRPEEIFESFEREPLASASFAQVHKATLPSGQVVAVKVQHRPLQRTVQSEIEGVDFLLKIVRAIEPAFGFDWLAKEIREIMPKELDFRLEAENCERCRKIMERNGLKNAVVVPEIHPEFSTKRLLIMDFEEGQSLSATAEDLNNAGIRPHAVVRRFAEAYAAMTFIEGFLHCDPHPGNVLWRRRKGAPEGFQLVLLDHGLYRELPDSLRLAYCRLWRSIAVADGDGVLEATRSIGVRSDWLRKQMLAEPQDGIGRDAGKCRTDEEVGDAETNAGKLFAAMLTARSFKAVSDGSGGLLRFDRDHRGKSREEDKKELSMYISGYYRGILEVLDTLPRPMILALKANDCLRATASRFEVPPSVPLAVSCLACLKALRINGDEGWRSWRLSWVIRAFLAVECMVSSRFRHLRHTLVGA